MDDTTTKPTDELDTYLGETDNLGDDESMLDELDLGELEEEKEEE